MKLNNVCLPLLALYLTGSVSSLADARRSENVRVLSDFVGTAGAVSKSSEDPVPPVRIVSAIGGLGGGVATGGLHVIKSGYAGSLFEVKSLTIEGDPGSIDEITGASEPKGTVTYDDDTTASVNGADIVWTANTIPLNPVTIMGAYPDQTAEVTGGPVFQNTSGTLTGYYLDPDITGTGMIEVLDTGATDTLAEYAGDGLDDGFQVAFFGNPPNPDAAPGLDPDGDGDDNSTEELTGFDPTDPSSFFTMSVTGISGGFADLEINKVMPGRTYTVRRGSDPNSMTTLVEEFAATTRVLDRAVQDATASDPKAFYQTEVTRP